MESKRKALHREETWCEKEKEVVQLGPERPSETKAPSTSPSDSMKQINASLNNSQA